MNVLEKLEARIQTLNRDISVCMVGRPYKWNDANERELLELAVARIRELENLVLDEVPWVDPQEMCGITPEMRGYRD